MEQENRKVVTVFLTRYHSTFSDFIYYATGRGYTHASIAIDDENEYYYSFNIRGFRKEYPKGHKRRDKKSIIYRLSVSEDSYEKIVKRIQEIDQNKEKIRYSRLGVLLCLLHIPARFKNRYFCSQFVTELLEITGEIELDKSASLYLPNELPALLERQQCLCGIVWDPI